MTKPMDNNVALGRAIAIAAEAHKRQYDRAGLPYILHPLKVMHYLRTDDLELMCIAVLHDVVEDTHITLEKLTWEGFSGRVIAALKALTKVEGQSYEDYKSVVMSNRDAMLVKMADLRHNSDIRRLKGITQKDIDRTNKYQAFYTEIKQKLQENV